MVQPVGKTVWQFLRKIHIEIPYDPEFLGMYPKELKTNSQTSPCIYMFIAA